MAGRKDNIKALFSNTRSRVIIIFTAVLMLVAILIGVIKLSSSSGNVESGANLAAAPGGIQSIPGSINPSAEYASLVESQNIDQAKQASKAGGSAIPTIIRTQAFGQGVEVVGPQQGEGGLGFSTLATDDGGGQRSLWVQSLKETNCSKASVQKAMDQGAVLSDLKAACSCMQLKDNGYALPDLEPVCSCKELKASGFNALQLKAVGYGAGRLRLCGFDACELRNAGFTAQEMKDGGYSDGEMKGAGFSDQDISRAGGLPDGITADDVRKGGCEVDSLIKWRSAGVSAYALRHINGCTLSQLKAAGYSAQDLKNAGFSATQLKNAGFTAADLKNAGFSAHELLNAGFTPVELANAGYTPAEIKAALIELPPGMTPEDVKTAGCNVESLKRERLARVSAASIKQYAGCSAETLKAAGYTYSDLADAGFTPQELKQAGLSPSDVIRTADCSVAALTSAHTSGVSATTIKQTLGCSAAAMKAGGYSVAELKDAGFTATDLKNAGFTAAELKDAGFTAADLKNVGFTAAELKDAGFTAADLKNAGFSAKELRTAGFTAQQLKDAGYTLAQLKEAGFSAGDLKKIGYTAAQLKTAGYSEQDLKEAGFPIEGSSVQQLAEVKQTVMPSTVTSLPSIAGMSAAAGTEIQQSNAKKLQELLSRQQTHLEDQRSQQKLQQRISVMQSAANDTLQRWKVVPTQAYMASSEVEKGSKAESVGAGDSDFLGLKMYQGGPNQPQGSGQGNNAVNGQNAVNSLNGNGPKALIKTGDVLFAVLDTSINSDEPGPILATIVSGQLKGAKLIGSFNLPGNADKMIISFNTMSVPGAAKSTSINAYAIDPNTARTALSSSTDHHYLSRYGSLFAATFLEGFGNAFQSANTTITIGGTGGTTNTTVSNGAGRSLLQNAVIGLATLGKSWGQAAQKSFNRPTTVQVCSGTGLGILFTQDLTSL